MKKENEKETREKIKDYFTKELQDKIAGMSNQDMRDILRGVEGTPIWIAILKYSQSRVATVQDSFLTLDPIKEGVQMARYQGAITGMLDLQDAILTLRFEAKKSEDPDYKAEKNKDDLGGAYGKG